MLLVLGGAHPLTGRIALAHIRTGFRVAVIFVGRKVIDVRIEIGPNDRTYTAAPLGLCFGRILIGTRWRHRRSRRCTWGGGWSRRGRACRCRSRCRLCGCCAGAATFYVGLFRNALSLVVSLVSSPFVPARLDGFLSSSRGSCR